MNHQAIRLVYPNAKKIDDTEGVFDFDGNQIVIDNDLVAAKIAELQAQYDANEYQRQRATAYPTWQDQLDKIYHEGIDAWKAEIQAIKDQYPKPDGA